MKIVNFNFENCFGIKSFRFSVRFKNVRTSDTVDSNVVIYAPNGTMKTSFAKTLECYSKGDDKSIKDELNESKKTNFSITDENNKAIAPDVVWVGNVDKLPDTTSAITRILASKALKEELDTITFALQDEKKNLVDKLKDISRSSDCEQEFIKAFEEVEGDTFYKCLEKIESKIQSAEECVYNFKYNIIFDKEGKVERFVEENKDLLEEYFNVYQKLLKGSEFFNWSRKGSFGTYQASSLQKSVSDNAFFEAKHALVLKSGKKINSVTELKKEISNRIEEVVNDPALKKMFDKIDKTIDKNIGFRDLKRILTEDQELIVELADYDTFRQKVWLAYLRSPEVNVLAKKVLARYHADKARVEEIINRARLEIYKWEGILSIFRERFHVPFDVRIKNGHDVVLNMVAPELEFIYLSAGDDLEKKVDIPTLQKVLSRGELRAFNILHFLFEIEARKEEKKETLLILDDVADSFDYRNKYAIVEYLIDISEAGNFKSILLTHNFDFYRNVCSRLGIASVNSLMVTRDRSGMLRMVSNMYRRNFFDFLLKKANKELKFFLCLIPFVRNLSDFMMDNSYSEFFTSCLHVKSNTGLTTIGCIGVKFKELLNRNFECAEKFGNDLYKESLYNVVDNERGEAGMCERIDIENKMLVAMALRLKAEEYMLDLLKDVPGFDLSAIDKNQTYELFKKFKEYSDDDEGIKILRRVLVLTPEVLHVNSFMYEPLIDMSPAELYDAYDDISRLLIRKESKAV